MQVLQSDASVLRVLTEEVGHGFRKGHVVHGIGKRFVYILRSESDPSRHYVGVTANVNERLWWHNQGASGQTTQDRPWKIIATIEFENEKTALRFERYLKSGSGRAFAKRHFDPN